MWNGERERKCKWARRDEWKSAKMQTPQERSGSESEIYGWNHMEKIASLPRLSCPFVKIYSRYIFCLFLSRLLLLRFLATLKNSSQKIYFLLINRSSLWLWSNVDVIYFMNARFNMHSIERTTTTATTTTDGSLNTTKNVDRFNCSKEILLMKHRSIVSNMEINSPLKS